MRARESMVVWTPAHSQARRFTPGDMTVVPWPDCERAGDAYQYSGGACYAHWHDAGEAELALLVMLAFHTCVTRDGIAVEAAHEALLAIDEYRQRISPDIPGAEEA